MSFRLKVEKPSQRMPAGWLMFAELERRVLLALLSDGALSREQLAGKLEESADGRLRGILANLTARKVLMVTADGYAVNAAGEEREGVRGWLGE